MTLTILSKLYGFSCCFKTWENWPRPVAKITVMTCLNKDYWQMCVFKLKFHGTDTDFLADFRTRIPARGSSHGSRCSVPVACRGARGPFSSPTKSADFCPTLTLFLARMSVGDARVYTCTCTVHDKLSCTHLQNYTIGASLKSVSVPWNLSFIEWFQFQQDRALEHRSCNTVAYLHLTEFISLVK